MQHSCAYSCAYNSFTAESPVSKRIRQQQTVKTRVSHVFTLDLHVVLVPRSKTPSFINTTTRPSKQLRFLLAHELTRAKFPNQRNKF